MAKNHLINFMDSKSERTRQLYNQCLEAYEKCRSGTGATFNGMPDPGMFNDEYNVPAELLFDALCRSNKKWSIDRHEYHVRLLEWTYNRKEWNLELFSKSEAKHSKKNKYQIYLELYYRCDNYRLRPFSKSIQIDEARIEWCSKREFVNKYNEYRIGEQKKRKDSKVRYVADVPNYKAARRFPQLSRTAEKHIHPIRITINSTNDYSATVLAIEKLDILLNCLNVSQGIQRMSVRLSGGSENGLGTKTVFVTTGDYIACGEHEISFYMSDDPAIHLPNNEYKPSPEKTQLFRRILKATTTNSVLHNRTENVVRDLALAYGSSHAGVKTLSYWRCLEHATRNKDKNRREKEIIEILKNQFKNAYWKQMGDLILKSRNQYVHTGLYSGKDEYADLYVNWAQKYAEQALFMLLTLFDKRNKWKSERDLDVVFDCYAQDDRFFDVANILRLARKRR